MKNQTVRQTAKEKGVHLWQLAERCGMTDSNFSRKLRRELPEAEQERLLAMIAEIAQEQEAAHAAENAHD